MLSYKFTKSAHQDLRQLLARTKLVWGVSKTRKYGKLFDQKIKLLQQFPDLGINAVYLFPGVKKIVVGQHMLFYRVHGDLLVILRVLHQNMDITI